MPDRVLRAMHQAAPNIYEGDFVDGVPGIVADLKAVARTSGHVAIYASNGHGAWEAAAANVFARGDKALVLATGRFAHGWSEMVAELGVASEILDFGTNAPIDPNQVETRLAADTGHEIRAVLMTQVDTSTSILSDVAAVRAALDAAGHPALLMVDCIACLACDRLEMDAWGADVMVAGSQKGLMTPPGLGFVFFNDRADAARDRADCVTRYWDWRPRSRPQIFYQYFGGTAPTHHLLGLREALDMIAEEGLETIWARHDRIARAVWAALETWAEDGPLSLNVANPAHRSKAVTSVRIGAPHGTELRHWLEDNANLTLGLGLGMSERGDPRGDGYFRIGHMGHLNAHMIMGCLGGIETGFEALGLQRGTGALEAAARVLSEN